VDRERRVGRFDQQSSGHPEVDKKGVAVVYGKDDPLAAARQARDRPSGQAFREVEAARRGDHVRAHVDDLPDPPPQDARRERRHDGLHFGEFGHRGPCRKGATRNFVTAGASVV
jgi:hypothetical protein